MIINADSASIPLKDDSVDLIIADPPYGINYQSARRTDRAQWKPKILNDKTPCVAWIGEAARVLHPAGAFICFCRWDTAESFRSSIVRAGLLVRSQVIWDREVRGMGNLKASFGPCHDILWFATKGYFSFPAKRPKSVLRAKRLAGSQLDHPNQKPVDLMLQLIEVLSFPNALVLDPFVGSGTTGQAAKMMGRRFIGIDLDPKWARFSYNRLNGGEK